MLAALVAGTAVIVAVASVGGSSKPSRLPALALGSRAADERASAAMYPYPGAVEYRVEGTLPRLADHAHAWTLGRDGDRDRVAALAKTLGLAGAVTETPESWTVRDNDRQLLVNRLPGLPWQLYSGGPECIAPDAAVSSPPASAQDKAGAIGCAVSAGGTATAVEAPPPPTEVAPCPPCPTTPGTVCVQCVPAPQPEPTPTRPADMPSKDEAARVARDLLTRTGLDLTGADVQVQDGFSQWSVQVAPTVGGLPTMGWTWSVAVGPNREIANASGWLAMPDHGDDYPLAGVHAGLKRL